MIPEQGDRKNLLVARPTQMGDRLVYEVRSATISERVQEVRNSLIEREGEEPNALIRDRRILGKILPYFIPEAVCYAVTAAVGYKFGLSRGDIGVIQLEMMMATGTAELAILAFRNNLLDAKNQFASRVRAVIHQRL